jgi:hypothetical protein
VQAIAGAKNLITLRLQTQLTPSMGRFGSGRGLKFTLEDARNMMMLPDENSKKLRVIAIANMQYKVRYTLSGFKVSVDFFFFFFGEKKKKGEMGS